MIHDKDYLNKDDLSPEDKVHLQRVDEIYNCIYPDVEKAHHELCDDRGIEWDEEQRDEASDVALDMAHIIARHGWDHAREMLERPFRVPSAERTLTRKH